MSLINVMKLPSIITRVFSYLRDSYAIDYRSLALFRIAVGLVVLVDLIRRLPYAEVLYSDSGMFPRREAIAGLNPARWSLLFLNGTPLFAQAVILIGIIAALAFTIGWRSRLAAAILWIVVVSVQVRNIGALDGSDTLIRVTLFWTLFLPVSRVWALDSLHRTSRQSMGASTVVSLATFGLLLQQAYMYLFTALEKDGSRWVDDGTALYYALGMNQVNTQFGEWVFQSAPSSLLTTMTFGTLILEFAVPIMLLLPIRSGLMRSLAVLLIWSLHLGIMTMLHVETFPLISMAAALALLPNWFWTVAIPRVASRFPERSLSLPIVRRLALANQPSTSGRNLDSSSSFLTETVNLHFVSQIRSSMASTKGSLSTVSCALAIVLITMLNVSNVSSYQAPSFVRSASLVVGLNQSWKMFAPQPGAFTYWFIAEGHLESGETVDLLGPITSGNMQQNPHLVLDQSDDVQYRDKIWRKYFSYIRNRETPKLRFAQYACRVWNGANSGEDRLVSVNLIRGTSRTLPDSNRADPEYANLGTWDCS